MFKEGNIIELTIIGSTLILLCLTLIIIIITSKFKKNIKQTYTDYENLKLKHEKELLKTKLEIQEETFNKISKEIHDNISLGLTLAKLQINNFLSDSSGKIKPLESSIDLISKSLVDLNDISKSLDGNSLTAFGLINALESEIEILNRSGIYKATIEIVGDPIYLSSEKDLILLRIFQEACNNILKHSKANTISIILIYNEKNLEMKIVDNGIGFDVTSAKNKKEIRKMSGLKNFETRAELIGAELSIISVHDIGTTICIKTPF